MAKSFVDVLKEQIDSRKIKLLGKGKRLKELLDEKPSRRRTRILNRLERHARVQLEEEGIKVGDDWSTVSERDWNKFFTNLLNFLISLLPLILPLFI